MPNSDSAADITSSSIPSSEHNAAKEFMHLSDLALWLYRKARDNPNVFDGHNGTRFCSSGSQSQRTNSMQHTTSNVRDKRADLQYTRFLWAPHWARSKEAIDHDMGLDQFIEPLSGLSLDETIDVVGWAIANVDNVRARFGILEQMQQRNGTISYNASLHDAPAISDVRFLSSCLSVLLHYTGILSTKLNMSYTTSHHIIYLTSSQHTARYRTPGQKPRPHLFIH